MRRCILLVHLLEKAGVTMYFVRRTNHELPRSNPYHGVADDFVTDFVA